MKLTKQQSAELINAIKATGKTMKHIARKYGFDYSLFRYWIHGQTSADKFNLYLLYAAALKDEVGWDMFAEPEKNQEE